ncbi:MAG: hypothetical protein A3I44_05345 [Candidatus Sungbacteria bacterium RIFCSPLOWO2_02_FULL_51_17]|uniref:Transcription regulator TrmB N-terminal domain-containing protein n=1 Tax=Candidatus Sungbacteria bacterium RIFCSPHIGHO2_02_FULL_51_29 TaxID=1802273 RepID=A0A1G2KQG5_9BACT|nr:MAG: hypothetical protein A2676_01060 [Candidatus Sungbacteria bacterium RIFCSPHIGHO2_01_FULL_51_22]OHA01670.1 MAG: hypothetical protein A3C16_04445 [Candidatus Sungbacteria bacterium RIFCSPHIGHO2_02_FULL_51_29]OHA10542.1 MAG: hypothetical protein A3I44_05345 [Candidatus Sungbacteria bacterium RIFCSPLOWO2_02_FULL_51_17]
MKIEQILQGLGLNEKQARIYLALLQLGRASAYAIADHAGIKRPTTYVVLGELIEKGLAARVPRMRKQLFIAQSPEEYFGTIEDRLEIAKRALPELQALANKNEHKPKVMYFEGVRGIKDVSLYRLKKGEKNIVGFYGGQVNLEQDLIDFFDDMSEKFWKGDFKTRGIAPYHKTLEEYRERDPMHGRTMKVIPATDYSSRTWIHVGESYVTFSAPQDKQAVIIENKDIAKAMRQIFELVWKALPEAGGKKT